MFAPVEHLGLVVLWDDGDDLHAEPRAPYPNAREVLALRAHRAGAAALIGGFARTAELAQLVQAGWARDLTPTGPRCAPPPPGCAPPPTTGSSAGTRRRPRPGCPASRSAPPAPRSRPAARSSSRCRGAATWPRSPAAAAVPRPGASPWSAGRTATGRSGWPASTPRRTAAGAARWRPAGAARHCGHDRLRAIVTGATRTAEELGRAFPGVKVRTSGGDLVLPTVPDEPALVISTPGAEPLAGRGRATPPRCCSTAGRCSAWPSLRAGEEALRRWLAAAALVRPDGTVLVHADSGPRRHPGADPLGPGHVR